MYDAGASMEEVDQGSNVAVVLAVPSPPKSARSSISISGRSRKGSEMVGAKEVFVLHTKVQRYLALVDDYVKRPLTNPTQDQENFEREWLQEVGLEGTGVRCAAVSCRIESYSVVCRSNAAVSLEKFAMWSALRTRLPTAIKRGTVLLISGVNGHQVP